MDIRSELRGYIASEILGARDPSTLSDTLDLLENGLDSLGILRLTVFIEERFGLSVPDEAVVSENVRTVETLTRLIESLQ